MSYLVVCPLSELKASVDKHRASHVLTVISPDMPVDTPVGVSNQNHLTLHFNDIGRSVSGLKLAEVNDIQKMVDFATQWDRAAPMIIHCWMGVSRSTASAITVLAALQPERPEAEIAAELRFAAPFASPNGHIIALADGLLDRGGRLKKAAADIGRGADCWQGTPFTLAL